MNCDIIPMEFNVVVRPKAVPSKTAGGIFLPDKVIEADKLSADEGEIVAVSPLAFSYAEWPEGARLPQVGDHVLYSRFAGIVRKNSMGEIEYRVLKDKEIWAVIEQAPSLAAAA
jgi:co-chaperonin GroES (HSP10)